MDKLFSLAGMLYHQGEPRQHWIDVTGTDPADYPGYIQIRNDACYWTPKAEQAYNARSAQVHSNWNSLGIAH